MTNRKQFRPNDRENGQLKNRTANQTEMQPNVWNLATERPPWQPWSGSAFFVCNHTPTNSVARNPASILVKRIN